MKILTIGEILYTQDKRFSPLHNEGSNVWMLKLTNPQLKDSGEYECQVSYHDDKEEKLRMPYRLIVLGKLKEFYIPFADYSKYKYWLILHEKIQFTIFKNNA